MNQGATADFIFVLDRSTYFCQGVFCCSDRDPDIPTREKQSKGDRTMIREAIEKIVNKGDLSFDEAYTVMNEIMNGE